MVSKYRSVLSVPGAPRLFASALVGRLPQGMSTLAILLLVRATTHSYAAGVLCSVLAGLAIAPAFSCQYALVGRSVTPGSETEAFTWISAALIGGLAAGSAIGGAVIGPGGVGARFVFSCAASLLAAAIAVGTRSRVRKLA